MLHALAGAAVLEGWADNPQDGAAAVVAGVVLGLLTPRPDLPPVAGAAGVALLLTLVITLLTRRAQLARAWKGQPA